MGGTGCGWSGSRVRHHENWGVFTAGSCTIVMWTSLRSCRSSVRTESVKPRIANFAPQYAAWSGIALYASADPTWTTTPRFRGIIRRRAAMVPWTVPRYVTSVARRNSSGIVSDSGANTVAMASFTQTSIGPALRSTA